ncbi:response regulator transcription factor [Herbaspirillum sp. RV1423]|uniref:response regulator transcription factor n=1 Tax=Herbaspirillum sp. RV1423 TaxID=1443993 RepID=UPI0004B89D8B|nr:response regulator transcription factor [Herbaspirillum sp. RV1423]
MKIACYIRNVSVFEQVRTHLIRSGFEVTHFDSETSLLRTIRRTAFDLVIIDIAVIPRDDDSIFSWLNFRSGSGDRTPTLILSPLRNADLVALALDNGADDFLLRPYEPVELVARTNALIRRSAPPNLRRTIEFAGFQLNRETAHFSFYGKQISLTSREFSMAWLFFSSPGVYISRETIGAVIWSADSEVAGRTIEQHVYKLRKKLVVDNEQIVMIRTAYSQGYRLELCNNVPHTTTLPAVG